MCLRVFCDPGQEGSPQLVSLLAVYTICGEMCVNHILEGLESWMFNHGRAK